MINLKFYSITAFELFGKQYWVRDPNYDYLSGINSRI